VVVRYCRPETMAEALELLGDGAIPLAGGTDIVPLRRAGALAPEALVDVKRLRELRGLDAGALGAGETFAAIAAADGVPAAVRDGAGVVGAWQTRSRATIGGNVCRSSPAGDALCGLLVHGAAAELVSRTGARRVSMHEFFVGPARNVRRADELLVRLVFPGLPGGSAYARFTFRSWMDLAVVGVAARVAVENGRCVDAAVAIGGVAPTPLLVPGAGAALVAGDRGAAADALVAAAAPIDDVRGTRAHRLRVLHTLAGRVIARAFERA
jgi:CO/xanthine dehydrogenase FAD-binding subunit